jgi:class 3 adenylate cyclase/tetratricopeptide (TPR) repeat protein
VITCAQCGTGSEGAKFCPECGSALVVAERRAAEERKVVTALFCDLVGFTSLSEAADPEDVNTMLDAYAAMARAQIEGHGGVVQKFIGDAVVGVFGVPSAHEDDPERAVRAALRIVEAAEELEAVGGEQLRLRVGINTGVALVRLGVSPGSGEGFLTGDAINTASRLQGVAPVMGVAVGVATYEATQVVFDYVELESATVKGKSEPVRVFQPTAPRARFGTDLTRTHSLPFVGREVDLALLKGIFDKAVASESVQLVSVVGEPGLGKSRIVAELGGYVDQRPELVTWRQGRCLPYGEGITFWALGEIVKAHAGILESDDPATATAKLDVVLPEGDERAWFRQRLLPLLGIEASSQAEREELFTAWRRWLELIAEANPTVLVFEDLHWADAALLAFLEHLADRAEGVPLMIVGTTRPELYEQHPDFGSHLRNATPITLTPLSAEETARLVSALLDASVIPVELQQPILERAGGNPLYAEEFVRLLKDKDLLVRKGSTWELREGADVPFPDSVRALIAARLDTLTPDAKSLLADAAVVGKVFWAGAVAAMGDRDPDMVVDMLRELSRKELVRPSRRSSMQGEAEYAFWHILTRDVAYNQLPRASRGARHVAAATWIEAQAPDRVEDLADVLAYHYSTALVLAEAAGQTEQASALKGAALRFLTLAGERALGLDAASALVSFERAVELTPRDDPSWPALQAKLLSVAWDVGERPVSQYGPAYREVIECFHERGELEGEAEALVGLADSTWTTDTVAAEAALRNALSLLETIREGPLLARAIAFLGGRLVMSGDVDEGRALSERALVLAARMQLPEVTGRALQWRGTVRTVEGDLDGVDDLREALRVCLDNGLAQHASAAYVNLGDMLWDTEGLAEGLAVYREGISFSEARGMRTVANWAKAETTWVLFAMGRWDECLRVCDEVLTVDDALGASQMGVIARSSKADVLLARGRIAEAAALRDEVLPFVLAQGDPQVRVPALATATMVEAAEGRPSAATTALTRVPSEGIWPPYLGSYHPQPVRALVAAGNNAAAHEWITAAPAAMPRGKHGEVASRAILAEALGHLDQAARLHADAASRWSTFHMPYEQALSLLGGGCCLLRLGQPHDAAPVLRQAREIFDQLGATPALAETDTLLRQATALTS